MFTPSDVQTWLVQKTIQKVENVKTKETVERWQFNIACDKKADESTQVTDKLLKAIQKEMKDMVRQIISSMTILPHLDDICSFDILAYTDEDIEWDDYDDHFIANSEEVKLKKINGYSTPQSRYGGVLQVGGLEILCVMCLFSV